MDGAATEADLVASMVREADRPGVVGVRLFAVHPGSAWVGTDRARAAVEAVADLGLVLVLTVFQAQLAPLRPLLEGHPSLPVAVDHCGFPDIAQGVLVPGQPVWDLADLAQVSLKVSSHLFGSLGGAGDPAPLVDQLVGRFGPGRLVWGSDYPQTAHGGYRELVDLGHRAVRNLDRADRAAVLSDNAAVLFDLHPPD
jgi:L-fuconolactonase